VHPGTEDREQLIGRADRMADGGIKGELRQALKAYLRAKLASDDRRTAAAIRDDAWREARNLAELAKEREPSSTGTVTARLLLRHGGDWKRVENLVEMMVRQGRLEAGHA
jgi:hypothetical protein